MSTTPRPAPGRLIPALGGAFVLALALPVFVLAGWDIAGWAIAAVLWVAMHGIELLIAHTKARSGNLAASGVQTVGFLFKAIGLLVVLLATAASDPHLALAAVLTYMLAYTFELALSLLAYYGGTR